VYIVSCHANGKTMKRVCCTIPCAVLGPRLPHSPVCGIFILWPSSSSRRPFLFSGVTVSPNESVDVYQTQTLCQVNTVTPLSLQCGGTPLGIRGPASCSRDSNQIRSCRPCGSVPDETVPDGAYDVPLVVCGLPRFCDPMFDRSQL
jgi:hypothetical protein